MNFQNGEFHFRWEWVLDAAPEALWPLVSDTNRFDADTGLPPLVDLTEGRLENAYTRSGFRHLGVTMEFQQRPFEWVRPYRFGVQRYFSRGPLSELRVLAELVPQHKGGTRLIYQSWAKPAGPVGFLAIPVQIGILSRRAFGRIFHAYARLAVQSQTLLDVRPVRPVHFVPGGRSRLQEHGARLQQESEHSALAAKLLHLLETADSIDLARLRPYALADLWGVPRRALLELCLVATRVGILEFRWDLLCPLCRNSKASYNSLALVQPDVHCETCNIDFSANFERSVELTFRPNPAIRLVEEEEFCIGGPQNTPHVVVQQLLRPGERRLIEPVLEEGRYQVRTLEQPGVQYMRVSLEGVKETILETGPGGWPEQELELAPFSQLILVNQTAAEQLFIIERLAWTDQAATAAEVTTLQRFRDLFSNEALRPGERISVGRLTVVFTDLRGSTGIYQEIGDAPAFGLVMDHFDVLREATAAEGGAIVKNMGDAIMAVFSRPVPALKAMLAAQEALARPPDGVRPLLLKAGIHQGTCIAVTLNDRLDYFGTTVNMAARLEPLSTGQEIIISEAVYRDPEMLDFLAEGKDRLEAVAVSVQLRGLGAQDYRLWKVRQHPL